MSAFLILLEKNLNIFILHEEFICQTTCDQHIPELCALEQSLKWLYRYYKSHSLTNPSLCVLFQGCGVLGGLGAPAGPTEGAPGQPAQHRQGTWMEGRVSPAFT